VDNEAVYLGKEIKEPVNDQDDESNDHKEDPRNPSKKDQEYLHELPLEFSLYTNAFWFKSEE